MTGINTGADGPTGAGAAGGPEWPTWVEEIDALLPVVAQFFVTGNFRDQFLHDLPGDEAEVLDFVTMLWRALEARGFEALLVFDPIDGFTVRYRGDVVPPPDDPVQVWLRDLVRMPPVGQVDLDELARILRCTVHRPGDAAAVRTSPVDAAGELLVPPAVAVVVSFGSRLVSDAANLSDDEVRFFATCHKLLETSDTIFRGLDRPQLRNPILWLLDDPRDVPTWLTTGDAARLVSIPTPTREERERSASVLIRDLFHEDVEDEDRHQAAVRVAAASHGLSTRSIVGAIEIARDRRIPLDHIEDAVRVYRIGATRNPWRDPSLVDKIRAAEAILGAQVIGQQRAVAHVSDILARSATGLTGAHLRLDSGRPRGVLFFAGPTGVGKTELARQLTQLIFGSVDAYTRFDMSEFASEHAEARLIGAPPGYVGFGAGGELTDSVRQQPYKVILFDEIEKAAPQILDKFLQILEDGRLTDGQGRTVHFSESILIFTSNLGVMERVGDEDYRAVVRPEDPPAETEAKIREGVRRAFVNQLKKPELLNRFGQNVVVFDFIQPEHASGILDKFLAAVVARLRREHDIDLELTPRAMGQLREATTSDLANGGRGIGEKVEQVLVNPLGRHILLTGVEGRLLVVDQIVRAGDTWTVEAI